MLPSENYEQPDLKGWIFIPDFQHTKNIKHGDDSVLARAQHFDVSLEFEYPNKKESQKIYDVDVERVSVKYFDLDVVKTLSVSNSYYYSSWGSDEMKKKIRLMADNPTSKSDLGRRTLFIPLEVDSVLLTFDAVLREGKYVKKISKNLKLEMDNVVVFDNVESIIVPMSMILHKKTTKDAYLELSQGH